MANDKEFTTITLRNLDSDENKGVVKIMNDVLNKQGIKTGQAIIEFIITDYKKLQEKLENERKVRLNLEAQLLEIKQTTNLKINELTEKIVAICTSFKLK